MALHEPMATYQAGARQLRSYCGDLSNWIGRIARRYTTAVILLAVGVLFVLVAAGFGIAAVFHSLELQYGSNIAFASVGGFFIVVGLIVLVSGMGLLKSSLPSMPRPTRQLQVFKRAAALDLILRRDQVQGVAQQHATGLTGAVALALGLVVAYGLVRLRSSGAAGGPANPGWARRGDETGC